MACIFTCALQDAPFFTVKLNVMVLPCVIMFSTGVAVDRVAGFDDFGAKDDFSTEAGTEWPFVSAGVWVLRISFC